jgi:hypothetical protein
MATINGTFNSLIGGTISGTVGTPGPQGPAGPAGAQGIPGPGVPVGGSAGQFLTKTTTGVDYATNWSTLSLAGYATESWVTAGFYPISGNPSGFLTAANLSGYATESFVTSQGYITSSALTPYLLSATAATTYAPIAAGLPTGGTVGQILTKNSGSNFDASFQTLIPGDRYLTTSTTSLTIDNANKTLTVGTGLSYTPQQDVVIAYDAANHMHAQVLTYNSGTGVMTVDVRSHSGSGTFSLWTVNVGGTVPEASVAWGSITGTLGNQTDLATALNAKLEVTTAASTYFTIASAAGKANLSGATFTGKVNLPDLGVNTPSLNLGGTALSTTATSASSGDVWISGATPKLTYKVGGSNLYCATSNLTNTFTSSQIIDVTTTTSAALRVTQKGAANAIEVEDSTTPDSTRFAVDQFGKVGIGVAPDTSAALKVDTNGIMFGNGSLQTVAAGPSWSEAQIYSFTLGSTFTSNTSSFSVSSTSSPNMMTISFSFGNAPALAYMLNQLTVTGRIYALDVNGVYDTFNQPFGISSSGTATATQSTSAQLNGQVYDVYLQFEPNGPYGSPAQFYVGQYTVT